MLNTINAIDPCSDFFVELLLFKKLEQVVCFFMRFAVFMFDSM